jgi:hypothetical protein
MKPSMLLACSLAVVACASDPSSVTRVFPLVAGADPRSGIQRVDIDDHKQAPPALSFEVDCRALPYAKGEERDFCYRNGSWAVARHERGIIVACSCGEFGGFVLWYSKRGELLQTLLGGDVPQALICDCEGLLCVTGLSHLSLSEGAVHAFRLVDERWRPVGSTALAKQVDRICVEADGSLVLELMWDGGTFRYRAGALEQLPSSVPPNTTQQPTDAPSGAGG